MTVQRPQDAEDGLDVDVVIELGTFRLAVAVHVAPGEVLGVIGPNGSGKSTLLRALAGLVPINRGVIRLDGQILDSPDRAVFLPAEQRPAGLVFQNYRLFPHLTVLDNVAFAARSRGARRSAARGGAQPWIDRLELGALAQRKPSQLSGGQAQRVALARALASGPGMLLLDEPLSALDARTKLEVRGQLRHHLDGFDGPTLIVTHDPLEAMMMTDRLLVIEDGHVVQQGPPAEVARRPATPYIARLVGQNLYAGELGPSGRTVRLDGGGELVVAAGPDTPPGRVLVTVRPTAIAVHTTRPEHSSPRNVWPGTVAGLELLTDRIRVQVDGAPSAMVDVTADAVADLQLTAGDPVWMSLKATEVDVYAERSAGTMP